MSDMDESSNRAREPDRYLRVGLLPLISLFWFIVLNAMLEVTPHEPLTGGALPLAVAVIGWGTTTFVVYRHYGLV